MFPQCPWCKKPLKKINNNGVYECRDCQVVVHNEKCQHPKFKQYHTPYMKMKHCLVCGEWFDEYALKELSVLEKRMKNRQNCVDRLAKVIAVERKRRGLK